MSATKTKDVLQAILDYKDNNNSLQFREWFLKQFEGTQVGQGCCLEEFAEYFLNALRENTERHLKVASGTETPKRQTPVRTLKTNVATPRDDSATTNRRLMLDFQQPDTSTPNQSFRMIENSQNSTKLRNEISQLSMRNEISQLSVGAADFSSYSMPTRMSTSADRSGHSKKHDTSTPIKRNVSSNSKRLSTTPSSSVCLGDFLTISKSNSRGHKKKNTSATVSNLNQSDQQQEKPKKRVQPISVSKKVEKTANGNISSVFAGQSSFSNDNNILKISHTEVEDKEQCAIQAARKILKSNASEITKELMESPRKTANVLATSTPTKQQEPITFTAEDCPLNLGNLEKNKTLQRLADVYLALIDLNMVTNFLNELSFLLNLLNASATPTPQLDLTEDFERLELRNEEDCPKSLHCLAEVNHAVCFALICLNQQKQLLASLDSKTLKVIINTGRFSYLREDVRTFLLDIYQRKQLILAENNAHDSSFCFTDNMKPCANVYFQQEQDSRQNFSSNQEFVNFRAQRDLFYKCLKIWERYHLNPNWKFNIEVGPTIREIFQHSELFVNMSHFANLFVSQLLLSASNASSPEEIGLDVDMQKLSRLTQRLIAPSQFSVDYQFPHAQAFFRDFILTARSLAFAEQLKMVLYSELLSLNDSSFEHINIMKTENETDNHENSFIVNFTHDQVAVRPEILNSMLILAKFLGFTISLPYTFSFSSSNIIPTAVEKKQINLRSLIQPNFNLHSVVLTGIEEGKLLITIPWMVQYISMLDSITLQLEVHTKLLKLLFALHWYLSREGANTLSATSKFIITACLSWLFDSEQIITEQYCNFRLMQTTNPKEKDMDLERLKTELEKISRYAKPSNKEFTLNPVLEALLPVACPFLGEFRVSIMPAKYASTKYASRSGRYRHITTRIAELAPTLVQDDSTLEISSHVKPKATQKSLLQAFFHSQNASIRQMITFCSERCYKCVVRDAQLNILLPCKSKADAKVNKINSSKTQAVYKNINIIYGDAHKEAIEKWNDAVPKMLDKRIKASLDSLLPEETSAILKKTYFLAIKNSAKHKISQWFYGNIIKDNYFCVDLQNVANKICTADKTKQPSELKIVASTPSLSELLSSLQYWLHCTSVRTELFQDSKPLVELLHQLNEAFKNVIPTMLYRLLAAYIIQLMQNVITRNCVHLTDELIEATCQILLNINKDLKLTGKDEHEMKHSIYGGLITVAFLQSLAGKSQCYTKFGQLVIAMIKRDIISLNYANQLFVSIFKHDWPPSQLNEISNMLRNISQATASISSGTRDSDCDKDDDDDDEKSNLFMDMLADLSRDVELY